MGKELLGKEKWETWPVFKPMCSLFTDTVQQDCWLFLYLWSGSRRVRLLQLDAEFASATCIALQALDVQALDCLLCICCQSWALITWTVRRFLSPEGCKMYEYACVTAGHTRNRPCHQAQWVLQVRLGLLSEHCLRYTCPHLECCWRGSFRLSVGLGSPVVFGLWCETMLCPA